MRSGALAMAKIRHAVAAWAGVSPDALLGRGKGRVLAHPRQAAMWLARRLTTHSAREVGIAFGRDSSTVIYAVQEVEARRKRDPLFAAELDGVEQALRKDFAQSSDEHWEAAMRAAAQETAARAARLVIRRVEAEAERDPVGLLARLADL